MTVSKLRGDPLRAMREELQTFLKSLPELAAYIRLASTIDGGTHHMRRIARIALIFALPLVSLSVSLSISSASLAEGFADLRVGGAFTSQGDVEISVPGFSVSGETEFDESITGGGRLGYWFEFLPWLGVAADASYFAADADGGGADIDVIPVSPLLMARLPLVESEEFPHGRVQPFLGIGPGIFLSEIDADNGYSDDAVDVGVDLHAGLELLVTDSFGVFVQYRFTSYEADYSDQGIDVDVDQDTHHVAGGVGFHF